MKKGFNFQMAQLANSIALLRLLYKKGDLILLLSLLSKACSSLGIGRAEV
jgi:hypothetical protein